MRHLRAVHSVERVTWTFVFALLLGATGSAASDEADLHRAEQLVLERLTTLSVLAERFAEPELTKALAAIEASGFADIQDIFIHVPRDERYQSAHSLRTQMDEWFDWRSIDALVSSGLRHDIGPLHSTTPIDVRAYIHERYLPLLQFAVLLRTGNERFDVHTETTHINGDVTVAVTLRRGFADGANLSFRLRPIGSTYLFVDVAANGASLLEDARAWYFRCWREDCSPPEN